MVSELDKNRSDIIYIIRTTHIISDLEATPDVGLERFTGIIIVLAGMLGRSS